MGTRERMMNHWKLWNIYRVSPWSPLFDIGRTHGQTYSIHRDFLSMILEIILLSALFEHSRAGDGIKSLFLLAKIVNLLDQLRLREKIELK